MGVRQESPVLRVIRHIAGRQRDERASDRDLLMRFAEKRNEDAFTALVKRHGPMVMGVGLRVLRNHADAEDVCQATFLLLAKKANTPGLSDSVANWLYEVAHRLSLNARRTAKRRETHEGKVVPKTPPDVLADISARDLQIVLDEELRRLPKKYRTPLLLCCLEGKTRDEAARFLGMPLSTVISRLEVGREMLRRRLAARRVPLSLALVGVTLLSELGRAAVPTAAARALSEVALRALAGEAMTNVVSANVASLIKGGMQAMFLTKVKAAGVALLIAGFAVCGLVIAALGAMPDSSLAQQPAVQQQDKAPEKSAVDKRADPRLTLEGHGQRIRKVSFSPDGKLLASAGDDRTIKIWDALTGKEIKTLSVHQDPVWSLAFSPDGKSLASVSMLNNVANTPDAAVLWDVATWEEKVKLKSNQGSFMSVTFSPDSKMLAATGWQGPHGAVKLWSTATGKLLATIQEDSQGDGLHSIHASVFSKDGKTLVLGVGWGPGSENKDPIRMWNWAENKRAGDLKMEGGHCFRLTFTQDGKTLITQGSGGDYTFWDFEKSQEIKTVRKGYGWFALSPDDKIMAVTDYFRDKKGKVTPSILLWDTATGEALQRIPNATPCEPMAFSPKGGMLAAACWKTNERKEQQEYVIRIWDVRDLGVRTKK